MEVDSAAMTQHYRNMQLGCLFSRHPLQSLGRLVLAGIAAYVAIDVLLAFLRPGYSLLYNAESDYGRGPWYWVMDINFLLRCALSLAITAALYQTVRLDGRTRAGLALLATWAICSGLLAFFADDPEGTPQTGSGIVHVILGFIAFTCITIGAILISASLMSDPAWRPAAPVLLAISIAAGIAYLLLGTAHKHHPPSGLYERIFLGLELLWIAVAASASASASARQTRAAQPEMTRQRGFRRLPEALALHVGYGFTDVERRANSAHRDRVRDPDRKVFDLIGTADLCRSCTTFRMV
jgi:hypothetical membrane protein